MSDAYVDDSNGREREGREDAKLVNRTRRGMEPSSDSYVSRMFCLPGASTVEAEGRAPSNQGLWSHLVGAPGANGFGSISTGSEVMEMYGESIRGKNVVITGSTSGMGKEVATSLCRAGANLYLATRCMTKGSKTMEDLMSQFPGSRIEVIEIDLERRAAIESFVEKLHEKTDCVDVLINNAATCMCPFRTNEDGIEVQFATNHLGHFYLTKLLLPLLENASRQSTSASRIVNVTCSAHYLHYGENPRFRIHSGIRFRHIGTIYDKVGHSPLYAYGQSKVANILHAFELNRRMQADGKDVIAVSVNPGFVLSTHAYRYLGWEEGTWQSSLTSWVDYLYHGFGTCKTLEQGIASILYCIVGPDVQQLGGHYFADCNVAKHAKDARNEAVAEMLWNYSEAWLEKPACEETTQLEPMQDGVMQPIELD